MELISEKYWFKNSTSGLVVKFKMAAENQFFLNNSRSDGRIFKIPTGYVNVTWHSHLKNVGSQNLLPVCSEKIKMAAENRGFTITP